MKKTLLLCFIHGFKGDDNTFGTFPDHLRALIQNSLPKVDVRVIVYPKFETRGDLTQCVSQFRDWLQEKVIDIEVSNATPSPTIDPSVRTILIGHSMGGIVAADAVLTITSDQVISETTAEKNETAGSTRTSGELNAFMFPYVQGVLAFDTPYLGISPGVVAHGAEGHYNTASSAITQLSGLSGAIWGGSKAGASPAESSKEKKKPVAALPAPESSAKPATTWQNWGKIAMYAGAGAAVAAGGAAAYLKREQITEGWSWVGSHLEFVGCLMKGEELKKRVNGMLNLNNHLGIGWGNIYTRLGKKALDKNDGSMVGNVIGNTRTFCNLPKKEARAFWSEAINDAATDETWAHMTMFFPKDNPGYFGMSEKAKESIVQWTTNEWYESSTGEATFGIEREL